MLSEVLTKKYVLASQSPRRKKLLKQIGLKFSVKVSNAPEITDPKIHPLDCVRKNSESKALTVAKKTGQGKIIIAADTIVVRNNHVLNKPDDDFQAADYLSVLSGKKHSVYTGIYLINLDNGKKIFSYEKTDVYFKKLFPDEIDYYIKHHNPLDKAGAYGIQDDFGCLFIKKIVGDYYNVVGLPLVCLYNSIKKII